MTAICKNVCFDVIDDIVKKHNNTVQRTIKMKPIDVTSDSYAFNILIKKILNLKLMIVSEYQNTKKILLKDILKNWSEVFTISKIKNAVP